jgi:hypothetical protein
MERRVPVLMLAAVLLGGCGAPGGATPSATPHGLALTDVPTSPAGGVADAPAALPERLIQRGRAFRGNPVPLGVLTGSVLLAAAVLGLYTLYLVYRRPDDDRGRSSRRHSPRTE